MPLSSEEVWTVERVQALPRDGNKYELVWGELLVSPAPRLRHQRVVDRLDHILDEYCRTHGLGEVFDVAGDISWSDDTLVQPDVFVVSPQDADAREWSEVKRLRLVVEVLSPSTVSHDRFNKRKLYQSQGVGTIWIVDADRNYVEVWPRDATFPTHESERVTWQPEGAPAPLVIDLAELFAEP